MGKMTMHKAEEYVKAHRAPLSGCAIFLLFAITPFLNLTGTKDKEEYATKMLLTSYSQQDVGAIKQKIKEQQQTLLLTKEATPIDILQQQFQNTIILGDSIAAGLVEYGILHDDVIYAKRGLRTDNCDEIIDHILESSPDTIFIELGMNDLEYCQGDSDRFKAQYSKILTRIHETLPNTNIFINAILPMDESAIDRVSTYKNYVDFNKVLMDLCVNQQAVFLDNNFILQDMEDKYEFDGIHPKYNFYQKWAENMAYIAGL